MTVLILAAGQQKRWGEYPIKQLLPIGDTTIFDRIVSQIDNTIVVTHREELLNRGYTILMPGKYRFTCETLLSTSAYWFDQITVLLGDVIYSHNTIHKIKRYRGTLQAFGNQWEIFALSFNNHNDVRICLEQTVKQAELGLHKGTLRNFFRNYTNTTEKDDINHPFFEKICHLTDYTNDIDTPEEYEAFLKQHLQTMIHDDNIQIMVHNDMQGR